MIDQAMKFHLQTPATVLVTGIGDGWIKVGTSEVRTNCVLTPEGVEPGFAPQGLDALTSADFEGLLRYRPEIVLLGTGATQHFLHPRVTQPLAAAHVGLEIMGTRAACRTFNILLGEGRRVIAALVV
ncbi:MAG TPA: Mth938-like domain-containing protein [Casimicrobiaceae bacterium]|nr:Mth938-like domain-containing protein [Casimicrobiaceae bacterium]